MRLTLLSIILAMLPIAASAQSPCGPQAPEITATGTTIGLCLDEPVDGIDAEIDGTVVRIPGPFAVGVHPERITIEACADVSLRARSYNAAGEGEWGPMVTATFRPCVAPVLLP